jgi:hypothetical protein
MDTNTSLFLSYTSPEIKSIGIDCISVLCASQITGDIEDYEEDDYDW